MAKLVSKTYAGALFDVALEQGNVDQILAEYQFVVDAIKQNPDFFLVLTSPKVSMNERSDLLDVTFKDHISETTLNFLKVLNDKKRNDALLSTFDAFKAIVDDHEGNVIAKVESVIPLDEAAKKSLEEKLNQVTGQKVTINNVINPDIMGGLVVQVGDKIIDGSIRRKLEHMKHDLAQIII